MMAFRVLGLSPEPFAPLFELGAEALASRLARRLRVDACPGFPCRVSLEDAEIGEDVMLTNWRHQPAQSPFQASHAIHVRRSAREPAISTDVLPPALARRVLSLRAFDLDGTIVAGALASGADAAADIEALLARADAAYVHAHYAMLGCYAARIERA